MATSLTLDFPSASLKSSTYVTSPTTWDIQRKNTKRTKEFKSPSLQVAVGLGNAATDGDVPLMINSQPRPTSHQTTPCLSGQWLRHPKAKAREKHSYIKTWEIQKTSTWSVCQQIPFMAVESCKLSFDLSKRLLEIPIMHKVKHYNIFIHIIKIHLATDATKSFNNQFYYWFEVTCCSWQCHKTSDNVTKFIFLFSQRYQPKLNWCPSKKNKYIY